jgi:hypothetical protein
VLPGYFTPGNMGFAELRNSRGATLYFLPWQGRTIVGSTDKKCDATSSPAVTEDEIDGLIQQTLVEHGYASREELRVAVEAEGFTWESYRSFLADRERVNRFQGLVLRNRVTISDDEAMENEITLLMGGQVAYTPKVYTTDESGAAVEVEAEFTEDPGKNDIIMKESGDPTGRNYAIQTEQRCIVSGQPVYMTEKQIEAGEPPLHPDYASERSRIVSTPSADGTWTHQLVTIEPVTAEAKPAVKKAPARRAPRKKTP